MFSFVTALYCAGFINGATLVWNASHQGQPMPIPKCTVVTFKPLK